jgi:TM2 domain-containing membrane protein YozV
MQVVDENGNTVPQQSSKRIAAGILAILLGPLGIHKFILGYTSEGIILLVCTFILGIITCGMSAWAVGIITLVEGIIYLTKSDEEFVYTYQTNKKGWF